jgi:hypothetical protein
MEHKQKITCTATGYTCPVPFFLSPVASTRGDKLLVFSRFLQIVYEQPASTHPSFNPSGSNPSATTMSIQPEVVGAKNFRQKSRPVEFLDPLPDFQ